MKPSVYSIITNKKRNKLLSVLIDPDTLSDDKLKETALLIEASQADLIFLGGSLLVKDRLESCVSILKQHCALPITLFPGSIQQISNKADAILFLSLISGRNPDFLIGNQVLAAPLLKQSGLEILSTGYMLIDSGAPTTVSYISNTTPIPRNKEDIAVCTAMAGEMLGHKLIYMDGGSGAKEPISTRMIEAVKQHINVPLIVGGGIRDAGAAVARCKAGADVIVVGNAIETNPKLIAEMAAAIHTV